MLEVNELKIYFSLFQTVETNSTHWGTYPKQFVRKVVAKFLKIA